MENDEILAAQSYAGPYTLEAFESGSFLSLIPNPTYKGVWGAPKNSGVIVRSYQENSNLVSDFKNGTLDAAVAYHRTIAPGLVALASENYAVAYPSPTVQAISMFVNFVNFPYGRASDAPDVEKAAAIRKALSVLIDREQLSQEAYFDFYKPMYAAVPSDIQFSISNEIAESTILNDEEKISSARSLLEQAGVQYPIKLDILFSSSRWGEVSLRLTTLLRDQLEKGSLFSISLSDVEWGERQDRRKSGNFELLIQMWGADFADADNYLTPMVVTDSRINNGYSNPRVDALAIQQAAATDEVRLALLGEMQQILNAELPLIPLISGGPIFFARPEIKNADIFVNREHKYLFSYLSR